MEQPNDTELMAYADGELPMRRASEIEQIARSDEEVRRRIMQFRQVRDEIAGALKPLAEEPVPEALRRAVRDMARKEPDKDDKLVLFRPRLWPRAGALPAWQMGIAAALLLMIGGGAGFLAGTRSADVSSPGFAAVGSHVPQDIASHMASLPSGTDIKIDAGRLRLIATVLAHGETPCREFEVDTLATGQTATGIACLRDSGWYIEIAVVAPATDEGFAPASSFSTLDGYLEAIGASEPLNAEAEEQVLKAAAGPH